MAAPRAIAFDFDGVIVESNGIKQDAFRQILSGFPESAGMLAYCLGNNHTGRREKFEHILKEIRRVPYTEKDVDALTERFTLLTRQAVIACPYVKGAVECLEDLSGRYPLYVASATPLDELRIILKARDLLKYFRDIYGVPMAKKDIFAAICRREKILPAELLFIGDSLEDQRSAEEAGTGFCAIDNGYFKGDSARKAADLSQIHTMLGGE